MFTDIEGNNGRESTLGIKRTEDRFFYFYFFFEGGEWPKSHFSEGLPIHVSCSVQLDGMHA